MKNDSNTLMFSFIGLFFIFNILLGIDYLLHNSLYDFSNLPYIQKFLSKGIYVFFAEHTIIIKLWFCFVFGAIIYLAKHEPYNKKPNKLFLLSNLLISVILFLIGYLGFYFYDTFIFPLIYFYCLFSILIVVVQLFRKPNLKGENILGASNEKGDFINFSFNVVYKVIKTE